MSNSIIALWHSAADAFEQRHRCATDSQLGLATPCDDLM